MSEPRLAMCPNTPNCVCSLETRPHYRVDPLPLTRDPVDALAAIRTLLESLPRCRIAETREDGIHAVFTTRWMRFRDDLEIWIDADNRLIHFRSASRLGYSDLGTNRRRVERIQSVLHGKV